MFPAILLAIPLYILFVRLGLLNSYFAIILGITGRTLPFGVWIMWQHFQSVPIAYEEAAWVDGASIERTVFEILFPMSFPTIAAVVIFSFAVAWNQYTLPRVIITNSDMFPITLGIEAFTQATNIQWRYVLTSSVLTVLPGLVMVTFLQEYFLKGFDLS
jgi:multiple sugar transport system permease protein